MSIPMDAFGWLDGSYVQIGAHGRAFYWNGEEWLKSSKDPRILRAELSRKANKFSKDGE